MSSEDTDREIVEQLPSAVAMTRRCLDAIERHDGTLNAMITVLAKAALRDAAAADAAASEGRWLGVLHGMPVVLKDNIHVAGVRSTSGSHLFEDFVPEEDAEVVRRLKCAGAVILGKANLQELAFGGWTYNPITGQCRNPWNPERIPGGSSGGSAVAVASGMSVGALGTDTGGSIRNPATINGVVGLRPTLGRVSNRGSLPVSPGFDTVGPLARRVEDVARLLAATSGFDPGDPLMVDRRLPQFLTELGEGVAGLRVGLPTNYYFERLEPEIEAAVRAGARQLNDLGAELVDVEVPGAAESERWMTLMMFADVCAVHDDKLRNEPEKFTDQVRERMLLGRDITGVDYARAVRFMEVWRQTWGRLFQIVDIVLTPSMPVLTPAIDDARHLTDATRDIARFLYGGALAAIPVLSMPCGFTTDGMPIGMQLHAARWQESTLFRAGAAYQSATTWHVARPPLLSAGDGDG